MSDPRIFSNASGNYAHAREGRNMGQRVLIEGMTWDEFALSSDRQV